MKKLLIFTLLTLAILTSCQTQFVRELTGEVHLQTATPETPETLATLATLADPVATVAPFTEIAPAGSQADSQIGPDGFAVAPTTYMKNCKDADVFYMGASFSNPVKVYTIPAGSQVPVYTVFDGWVKIYPLKDGAGHYVQDVTLFCY